MRDLIVVGGSTIGLYLAEGFAKKGNSVLVLEAKERIGEKSCSGHYSKKLLDYYPEAENLSKNSTKGIRIYNELGSYLHERKKDRLAYTLEREDLDRLAFRRAREEGVEVIKGFEVDEIGDKKVVGKNGETFYGAMIAGCDGVESVVRNSTDISRPEDIMNVIVAEVENNDERDYCTCNVGKDGLLYCSMPKGDKTEYAVKTRENPERMIEEQLEDHGIEEYDRMLAGKVPVKKTESFYEENKFLVGDSAGQTKPFSVTGLTYGLRSAEIAIRTIDLRDISTLEDYEDVWHRELGVDWLVSRLFMYSGYAPQPVQSLLLSVTSRFHFGYDRPMTELKKKIPL